jgi:hypothetical protein
LAIMREVFSATLDEILRVRRQRRNQMRYKTGLVMLIGSTLAISLAATPSVQRTSLPLPADLSTTTAAAAFAGAPALKAGEVDLSVEGVVTKDGLQLSMFLGRAFTRGVKIYSEPSHTLIAVGSTPEYAASAAGRSLASSAQANFAGSFPNATPRIHLPGRPTGDYGVMVYAITSSGDFLMAAANVGASSFHWSGTWHEVNGVMDPTWCCHSNTGCDPGCIDCPDTYFTCCTIPCDCSISCGWVMCGSC